MVDLNKLHVVVTSVYGTPEIFKLTQFQDGYQTQKLKLEKELSITQPLEHLGLQNLILTLTHALSKNLH